MRRHDQVRNFRIGKGRVPNHLRIPRGNYRDDWLYECGREKARCSSKNVKGQFTKESRTAGGKGILNLS